MTVRRGIEGLFRTRLSNIFPEAKKRRESERECRRERRCSGERHALVERGSSSLTPPQKTRERERKAPLEINKKRSALSGACDSTCNVYVFAIFFLGSLLAVSAAFMAVTAMHLKLPSVASINQLLFPNELGFGNQFALELMQKLCKELEEFTVVDIHFIY